MPTKQGLKRFAVAGGAVLLLLIFAGQMIHAVLGQSLTWDEDDHIFAGYRSWLHLDFGINPEHPPLAKYVATVPLLLLDLHEPSLQSTALKSAAAQGGFKLLAYMGGRALLFGNGPQYSANTLVFEARMAAMSFALLMALLVFFAAREMFSDAAGLLALVLLVFEPNIVAHGAYVATDTAVSCFMFASVYAFYRYVRRPTPGRMVVAGLAAGLALGSKHSAILLLPILILLAVGSVIVKPGGKYTVEPRWPVARNLFGALIGISLIAIGVLWALYGFRYNARPAGLALAPSLVDYARPLRPFEAHGILLFARWHLLPESYLYGLVDVRRMSSGMQSYLFGKIYEHGVWFYFPAVFVIKSTLGFLGLFALSLYAMVAGRMRRRMEVLFLTLPAAFYFAVAMGSSLNIGARHILPVYVFLCVLLAGAACALMRSSMVWRFVVAALVLLHVGSSLRAYPNDMAYANELWGGPSQTYRYLSDSNTDWGQQLIAVKQYVDEHHITDCWFGYFVEPMVRFEDYGIPCKPLPTVDSMWAGEQYQVPVRIDGPVFISAGTWSGFEFGSQVLSPFRVFQQVRPVTSIQDGVLVFDGSFDVPLASALAYVQRSDELLRAKQPKPALAQAQMAVGIDADALQTQLALGNALTALHRDDDAHAAYGKALVIAHTMEPEAQEVWVPRIQKKMGAH